MGKKWVALFSQTGSEIYNLSQALGRFPDMIISNTYEMNNKMLDPHLTRQARVVCMDSKRINDELMSMDPCLVTLHGYLKILPNEICERHEIYNGHPGLITLYPDLKGKDPQDRVWQNLSKYDRIGSVVHKCIAEVDSGKIESVASTPNQCSSEDDVYNALKDTSFKCWFNFLKDKI